MKDSAGIDGRSGGRGAMKSFRLLDSGFIRRTCIAPQIQNGEPNAMKHTIESIKVLTALSAIILLWCSKVPAADSRFYLRAELGGNVTQDAQGVVSGDPNFVANFGVREFPFKVRFDPGEHFSLAGGHLVTDWLAAEAEVGGTLNEVRSVGAFRPGQAGTFANVPLLFNARLQYPNRSHWTPFVGAGVGPSAALLDADVIVAGATFTTFMRVHVNDPDVVLTYQAFAGLRYSLNQRVGLSLEYRYIVADAPEWKEGLASIAFGRVQSHAFSLGLDYRF